MKLIKSLLFLVFGFFAIWFALTVLGILGTIAHIVFWAFIIYLVGFLAWKILSLGKPRNEIERAEMRSSYSMANLKEASSRLEEMRKLEQQITRERKAKQ
ncbi:MAG: hypothetical protein JNN15_13790 [Blastocatellia bacterium]|nr:hypothetical protein [Blastocatellia bacterium]